MAKPDSKSTTTTEKAAPKAPKAAKPVDYAVLATKAEKLHAKIVRIGKRIAKADEANPTLPELRGAVAALAEASARLRKLAPAASGVGF